MSCDDLCNSDNISLEHVIRDSVSLCHCEILHICIDKILVRDNDKSINVLLECFDTLLGSVHLLDALELERLCNNADGELVELSCDLCDNRSCACTCAAAHTGGDEYHISVLDLFSDLVLALLCGRLTDLRLCACAESLSELSADLDSILCIKLLESLCICIYGDILNVSSDTLSDNAVKCVSAAAADTDDLYLCACYRLVYDFVTHIPYPPILCLFPK